MGEWVHAVDGNDVPPGKAARVFIGGKWLAICNDRGRYVAVDDACPHEGGSLGRGHVADGCIVCSVHHWPFDLNNGLTDPNLPLVRLKFYPCQVEAGKVYVDPGEAIPPSISDLLPDEE